MSNDKSPPPVDIQLEPIYPSTADPLSQTQQHQPQEQLKEPSILAYEGCGRNTCCFPSQSHQMSVGQHQNPLADLEQQHEQSTNGRQNPNRPHRCCSQRWWLYTALVVAVIRAVIVLFSTTTLIASLIVESGDGYWFAYFTNLSYVGLIVYFWMALGITLMYLLDSNASSLRKRPARVRDIICSVLYTTSYCFHVIVPLVYWALLSSGWDYNSKTDVQRWLNFGRHGADFVMMFIEFFLNRIVFAWGHLIIAYLLLILYICWGVMLGALYPEKGPPYFFLYLDRGSSWIYVIGIAVITLVIWALLVGVHWLRSKLAQRVLHS